MSDSIKYFLGIDGEQVGPYTKQEVLDKVNLKEVREVDMIWYEGQTDWIPLSQTEFFKKTIEQKKQAEPKKEVKRPEGWRDFRKEKVIERKRPKIGGDVESVLSGKSSIENHPTFAQGPDVEPAFKFSQLSNVPYVDYRLRFVLIAVAIFVTSSLLYFKYVSTDEYEIPMPVLKSKGRPLKDRQQIFSQSVSTIMTNSKESVLALQKLLAENPNDEVAKQTVEQLTSFYRTMQRYGDAGQLMMQVNRPDEAVKYFTMDSSLITENENATWQAYLQAKGEERKTFLVQNIQILTTQLQDQPRAVGRIKILENEFPKFRHPYGYYIKGTDEKISDLFSRTSFFFVQSLLTYLNTELPQLKLSSRPLVEIKKSKTQMYRLVGRYNGEVTLSQDKLNDIFFTFWFSKENWHIVDTNLTKERSAYARKEKANISDQNMSGDSMLKYMEGVFRTQFPKIALHEVVDTKK